MQIYLQQVSKLNIKENTVEIKETDYEKIFNKYNCSAITEEDYLKLPLSHPIKKVAIPLIIKCKDGYMDTEYIFLSKTIFKSNFRNFAKIEEVRAQDICTILCRKKFVNDFNLIRELIIKGYFSKELLEEYNDNCFFLIV